MILHLQKVLLASVVATAMGESSYYIPNTNYLSLGLQTPLRTIFPLQRVKIEQNIFTLWSAL